MSGDFTDLLLPFGENHHGRLVSVDMVERGAACGCFCPQCHTSLVARKGAIRCHHFAHAGDPCGGGALETALHKMSKQIICDEAKIWLPEIKVSYPPVYHPGVSFTLSATALKAGWFEGEPSSEKRVGDVQPDVVLTKVDQSVALELYVTHAVSAEKRTKVRESQIDMVEIDLSAHPRSFVLPVLRDFVLREAPRFWIYSKIEVNARADIYQRWIVENDRREKAALLEAEKRKRAQEFAFAQAAYERLIEEEARRRKAAPPPETDNEAAYLARYAGMANGMLRAALMRPPQIDEYTAGCFCGQCGGTAWHRLDAGWICGDCILGVNRQAA